MPLIKGEMGQVGTQCGFGGGPADLGDRLTVSQAPRSKEES